MVYLCAYFEPSPSQHPTRITDEQQAPRRVCVAEASCVGGRHRPRRRAGCDRGAFTAGVAISTLRSGRTAGSTAVKSQPRTSCTPSSTALFGSPTARTYQATRFSHFAASSVATRRSSCRWWRARMHRSSPLRGPVSWSSMTPPIAVSSSSSTSSPALRVPQNPAVAATAASANPSSRADNRQQTTEPRQQTVCRLCSGI